MNADDETRKFIDQLGRPAVTRYAQSTAERMGQSAFVMQIFTPNFAKGVDSLLQFAIGVMLDKPLYILAPEGTAIPAKVRLMADGIEFFNPNDTESMKAASTRLINAAMEKGFSV